MRRCKRCFSVIERSEAISLRLAPACVVEIASSRCALLAMTADIAVRMLSLRAKRSNLAAMEKPCFVYILTNKRHTVLYTGVTSDLQKRVYQHRMKLIPRIHHALQRQQARLL